MSERRFTDKKGLNPGDVWGLEPGHPAMVENRTLFPSTVVEVTQDEPDRLLVSGKNNRKLGATVEKGRFKGYGLFGLSLEERSTCPKYCAVRDVCYGNGMPLARRHRIGNREVFFSRIENEIAELLKTNDGLLIRLHVLGDFPDVEYVAFWTDILNEFDKVAVYGYTARRWLKSDGDEIGQAIYAAKAQHPERFRIRWSAQNTQVPDGAKVLDYVPPSNTVSGGLVCPAQTDNTACCATCGLCWEAGARDKTILFIKHGRASLAKSADVANNAAHLSQDQVEELRERVAQFEEILSDSTWVPHEWGLSPSETKLLNLMAERNVMTKDSAMTLLYGNDADGGAEEKIIDVFICKMRPKLAPMSIEIVTLWGRGWHLTQRSKDIINNVKRGLTVPVIHDLGTALVPSGGGPKELPKTRLIVPIQMPQKMRPARLTVDRPDVRMIRIADMRVEESYQRNLSAKSVKLIRQIVVEWDWGRFKPPIVADAGDGTFFVIDGQHTSIAAATHPSIAQLPCVVIKADSIAARAASFVAHNTARVPMTTHQIFRGRVASNDAVASDLNKLFEKHGGFVPKFVRPKDQLVSGEVVGIGEIERTYKVHGSDMADRIIEIVFRSGIVPVDSFIFRAMRVLFTSEFYTQVSALSNAQIIESIQTVNDGVGLHAKAESLAADTEVSWYVAGARLIAIEANTRVQQHSLRAAG